MNKYLTVLSDFRVVMAIVLLGALSRLLPHPYNFTPLAAICLFGGAYLQNSRLALGITLSSLLLSDALLHTAYLAGWRAYPGFYALMPFVYGGFGLVVVLGHLLNGKVTAWRVGGAALVGSVTFFMVSNFGVWLLEMPHTWTSLVQCYVQAIPFFGNTLAGDFLYSFAFFGIYEYAKFNTPALQRLR